MGLRGKTTRNRVPRVEHNPWHTVPEHHRNGQIQAKDNTSENPTAIVPLVTKSFSIRFRSSEARVSPPIARRLADMRSASVRALTISYMPNTIEHKLNG